MGKKGRWVIGQIGSGVILTLMNKWAFIKGVEAASFAGEVLLLAGILFGIEAMIRQRTKWQRVSVKDWGKLIVIAIIGGGLANMLAFLGLKYSQASNYAFLSRTTVIFTGLFSMIWVGEKLSKNKLLTIVMVMVGAYLMTLSNATWEVSRKDWLIILSAVGYSISYVLAIGVLKRVPLGIFLAVRCLLGGIFVLGLLASMGWLNLSNNLALVGIGGVLMTISMAASHKVIKLMSATHMTVMGAATPVITSVLAIILWQEIMEWGQIFGAGIIVSGLLVELVSARRVEG